MYRNYWGIKARPFENIFEPAFYFPASSHQLALLRLRYTVEDRGGCALLSGPYGIGKTGLLNQFQRIDTVRNSLGPFVSISFISLPPDELLAFCATRLIYALEESGVVVDHSPTGNQEETHTKNFLVPLYQDWTVSRLLFYLELLLKENQRQGHRAVLIVDDADLIDNFRILRMFKSLLNMETAGQSVLSLIFVEGESSSQTSVFRELLQESFGSRIEANCKVVPFSHQETGDYISHRLMIAGCPRQVFLADAAQLIYEKTRGIPRDINRICDLALLVGYAEKMDVIRRSAVEALYTELA